MRTKEVARLTTGDICPPTKRLCTAPRPVLANPSSSSESEMSQDEEASSESEMSRDKEASSESETSQDEEASSKSETPQEKEASSESEMPQEKEASSESETPQEASSESEMPQEKEASSESEMPQEKEANSEPEMSQDEENGSGSPAPVEGFEAFKKRLTYNLRAELKEVQNDRSKAWAEFELGKKVWEAEKKVLTERLDKEFNNFAAEIKEVLKSLSKSEAELERTSQERDSYRNNLELGKNVWEAEKKSLTDRLTNQFNVFGAELKEVLKNLSKSEAELEQTSQEQDSYRNSLELGNKVWEAERIEMAKKITMVNKEKENAYCKGYLDGWFKKPHAYVHAWHDVNLADEVTDLPVLQMMSKLPKSYL